MGAKGAWHPQNFRTSRLAPADFEGLSYRTDGGTRSFKFLTQALGVPHLQLVKNPDDLQEKFHAEFLLTSIFDKHFYLLRKQQL